MTQNKESCAAFRTARHHPVHPRAPIDCRHSEESHCGGSGVDHIPERHFDLCAFDWERFSLAAYVRPSSTR
jgi:hypothetical protein